MEFVAGGGEVVVVEFLRHPVHQILHLGPDPRIERMAGVRPAHDRLKLCRVCVGDEEAVDIPQGQKHVPHGLFHEFLGEPQVFRAHSRAAHQRKTHGIRPVARHHLHRVRVVAQSFTHLLPVFSQYDAVHHHMPERRFIEECSGEHHQRVEPCTGLVQPFRNEVGRESGRSLAVSVSHFEGIVPLGVGHGAALEPAVHYLRDALHVGINANFDLLCIPDSCSNTFIVA